MKKFILRLLAVLLALLVTYSVAERLPLRLKELSEIAEATLPCDDPTSKGSLILVNKKHKYRNGCTELVNIYDEKTSSYVVSSSQLMLAFEAMQPLNEMMEAFRKQTGNDSINILSAYRSYETQKEIYEEKTLKYGISYTKKHVQLPGTSEHHTGLAVDLGIYDRQTGKSHDFNGSGDYSWFEKNSWKYGFILRYPESKESITGISYEPWHFRYVGKAHAAYMYKNDLCLEEYISLLKKSNKPLKVKTDSVKYKISYSKQLPEYTYKDISGDNTGGFVGLFS